MDDRPVRIGVVGSGGYALHMIKYFCQLPKFAQLAGVVSPDPGGEGENYCKAQGIPVYPNVDALIRVGGFEIVYNPTPIHLHGVIARKSLAAGYSVWMEKPPLATIQELDALNAYAKELNLPVVICFNSLFSRLTRHLKETLVSGRLGKVKRVKGMGAWIRDTEYFTRNDWAGKLQVGGEWILDGDLNNPFAHVLCNNLYFASPDFASLAEPETVQAELYRSHNIESEDTSCIRILTTDGVEIINWLTLTPSMETPPLTEIETEHAHIVYDAFKRLTILHKDGSEEVQTSEKEDRVQMIEYLCSAHREKTPYISSLEMVRPFTVAVNAAFDSAGEVIPVPVEFVECCGENGTRRVLGNIDSIIREAFEKNLLYSELGVPWAHKTEVIQTKSYSYFPTRFGRPSEC